MKNKQSVVWVHANDLTENELLGITGLAKQKLVLNGDCLEWGFTKTSGNHHTTKLKTIDENHIYKVYTLDALMRIAGKPVSTTSLYQRTCGNPRCMNVEHCVPKEPYYPDGVESPKYQDDYHLAQRMLQFGWALGDIRESTSQTALQDVKFNGVEPNTEMADRQPLTYAELLKLAEYLRTVGNVNVHIQTAASKTGIKFERLVTNGGAVKALRRRDSDDVVWLLSWLCQGVPLHEACKEVGKGIMYGTQLLGACYG